MKVWFLVGDRWMIVISDYDAEIERRRDVDEYTCISIAPSRITVEGHAAYWGMQVTRPPFFFEPAPEGISFS